MAEARFQRFDDGYAAIVDGEQVATAYTEERDGVLVFTHTETDPAHEGEGLGSRLAQAALDDVRDRGLRIVPRCPFIAHFVQTHEQYADLLA